MFILINGTGFMCGIFSTMERMIAVIEEGIKSHYESEGFYGNFNYRYIECNLDEPYFSDTDEYKADVGRALFSLHTMHDEYFTKKVKTDWKTGKILSMDANDTTNVNENYQY